MRDLLIKNVTYDNALYARNGNYNYNTDGQKGGEGGRAGELVPLFRLAVFNPFKISMP